MNVNISTAARKPLARRLGLVAGVLALAAAGTASAAVMYVEQVNGTFLAEVFPDGAEYQHNWSVSPNLVIDQNHGNAIFGHCLIRQGYGTVHVTVTYPNGHTESTQRGVNCKQPGHNF